MLVFLMIYLAIGMVCTAVAMYQIGKHFGSFIKAAEYYYPHDSDFLSFCYRHPVFIEWASYIGFTLMWPIHVFKRG